MGLNLRVDNWVNRCDRKYSGCIVQRVPDPGASRQSAKEQGIRPKNLLTDWKKCDLF